jgi:NitT/TauT family transport system substrate-binding protein
MDRTRRNLIGSGCWALGASLVPSLSSCAPAPTGRQLQLNIASSSLGIHIPCVAAIHEILPATGRYAVPDVQRVSKLETITQAVLTGSADLGTGDAISALRAVQAGADLKIIGNCFFNTSLVFVVNGDRVRRDRDLLRKDVTIAVNSEGDFTHVMLALPLRKRGIDVRRANVITMGGSGSRFRALVAGKIDAAPVHFDQAMALSRLGNYRILIKPWEEFDHFLGEVWIAGSAWLERPENQRAATDLMKAVTLAFRRAHADPAWYARAYRRYGTDIRMRVAADADIERIRLVLADTIKAWPTDMAHRRSVYEELLPQYQSVGALASAPDPLGAVETRYAAQALEELQVA